MICVESEGDEKQIRARLTTRLPKDPLLTFLHSDPSTMEMLVETRSGMHVPIP
jgi:hypothetical protein